MSRDRPSFRRTAPPVSRGRVPTMSAALLVVAGLLSWRALSSKPAEIEEIPVEIVGDVQAPGTYFLTPPATVHSALRAAGESEVDGFVDAAVSGPARLMVHDGRVYLETFHEPLVFGLPLDLNTASATALEALPGVGSARAQAIVDERERGGAYGRVEDLTRVHGVGPATVDALRPFVEVAAEGQADVE